jgi:hypothetical protein
VTRRRHELKSESFQIVIGTLEPADLKFTSIARTRIDLANMQGTAESLSHFDMDGGPQYFDIVFHGRITWLGHERFAPPGRTPFAAAMAAELEPEATAVVVALTPHEVLVQGLPWLHIDQVFVLQGTKPHNSSQAQALQRCLDMIAPHAVSMEHRAVQ